MVNAQEWLEKNYPDKETYIIYLNQQLEGLLDCSEYKILHEIYISASVDISKFEIKKGSYQERETKIIFCIFAQTYLDQNYPKQGTCQIYNEGSYIDNIDNFGRTREEVKKLNMSEKGLEGELDLSDFKNLEKLYCYSNYLTNLDLTNCKKLKLIFCPNNQITTLNLSNLEELETLRCSNNYLTQIVYPNNPEKITALLINDNNTNFSDLTIFSKFGSLEQLEIGNYDENKIQQRIYNHFYGSLEPLKDLNKLYSLDISNTDINSGLEHLPESVKNFRCSSYKRKDAKVRAIKADWEYCGEDIKTYRELVSKSSPVQQWLDENYPLNEPYKWEKDEENYNKNKRAWITSLNISDISNQTLKGGLRLKGFTKLENLYCYDNQLTHLDLGDCENLNILHASNNKLSSLHFLKLVPKLNNLEINNNPNLLKDGLKIIAELKRTKIFVCQQLSFWR